VNVWSEIRGDRWNVWLENTPHVGLARDRLEANMVCFADSINTYGLWHRTKDAASIIDCLRTNHMHLGSEDI
jgi:hypothetical protein